MAPTFVRAGAGVVNTGTSGVACTIASGVTVGNLIVLHIGIDAGSTTITLSSPSGVENLARTAAGMTLTELGVTQGGNPVDCACATYVGWATASAVSIAVAPSAADIYYRLYEFAGVYKCSTDYGGIYAGPPSVPQARAGGGAETDTTIPPPANSFSPSARWVFITSDATVIATVICADDNALAPFTGETGGDWVEAVAEFASATGTDMAIQLQTLTGVAGGSAVVGGSQTMAAADGHTSQGFELKGDGVSRVHPPRPRIVPVRYVPSAPAMVLR